MGVRPSLSIVLSTLGNYPVLKKVLDGYDRQTAAPGSFELLVVADRKEPDLDAVDAAIGERSYPVRRLVGSVPGLSANRNTGWQAARAPVVLFTDNDTIPVPRLVAEHIALHERHPEDHVAVVGHVRWAKGIRVTPFMRWLDDGVQFQFGTLDGDEASWAHLYGANSSIKRSFLQRVGGYDEERLPYLYEDAGHERMVFAAGFEILERSKPYCIGFGPAHPARGRRPRELAQHALRRIACGIDGVPQSAVLARPRV
jgi:glycosyltransferase involved in cell wall biosynthesis